MVLDISQLALVAGFLLVLYGLFLNAVLRLNLTRKMMVLAFVSCGAFLCMVFMFCYWASRYVVG